MKEQQQHEDFTFETLYVDGQNEYWKNWCRDFKKLVHNQEFAYT